MARDIIKLASHSYMISSFLYPIEKYVKDKRECRKSAAVQCCLSLRIDYCDERLVYTNGDISVTKSSTHTNHTSIKSPDFSLFNDIS